MKCDPSVFKEILKVLTKAFSPLHQFESLRFDRPRGMDDFSREYRLLQGLLEKSRKIKDVQVSNTKILTIHFLHKWLYYIKTLSEMEVPLERANFSGFSYFQDHGYTVIESLVRNE